MSKFELFAEQYLEAENERHPRPVTPQFAGVLVLWFLLIFAAGYLLLGL